jgi:hypothetical protein
MSTAPVDRPVVPEALQQSMGQAARARVELREQKLTQLELQGDIKPATILNLSPFELALGDGLISFKVPACPLDKKFIAYTRYTPLSYPIYRGNQQMSDKSIQAKYDVNIILPVQQLMEFKHYYMGESEEDQATKQGGVVVIEGAWQNQKPDDEVRVPFFMFRKNNRYIAFNTVRLEEVYNHALDILRKRCMFVMAEADRNFDLGNQHRANIQHPERVWHDFALRKQWITESRPWRNADVPHALRCPRCSQQYTSKTGACKCGYVVEPLVAYMNGEISIEHVRLNTLTKAEWIKVNAEQKRRDEARA